MHGGIRTPEWQARRPDRRRHGPQQLPPRTNIQLVPLSDAAARLNVSTKTLRRRIADGSITGYRIGRLVRVDLEEVTERLLVAIPTVRGAR
uniref:excisionase family DNA-binding protein n=1 Tax=Georgenia yuyongxinii TaxID=2589797 RepID=UPI0022AAA442|nr:excisionase family DNA-binding protein [Georgenia yuyongxinii]